MGMSCSLLRRFIVSNSFRTKQLSTALSYSTVTTSTLAMPKRKRTQQEVEMAHAPVPIPVPTPGSTPTRPKRTRSPKKKVAEESWDAYGDPQEAEGSPLTDLDVESSPKKAKKGGGKRKAKEPVVYTEKEIPPVERKFIDFKGAFYLRSIKIRSCLKMYLSQGGWAMRVSTLS